MAWIIKTDVNKLEIWSEDKYKSMTRKCLYYGSKPGWSVVSKVNHKSDLQTKLAHKINKSKY